MIFGVICHEGEGGYFVGVGAHTARGSGVPERIGIGGTQCGLGRGELAAVASEMLEKGADVGDMSNSVGIEGGDIVEIGFRIFP